MLSAHSEGIEEGRGSISEKKKGPDRDHAERLVKEEGRRGWPPPFLYARERKKKGKRKKERFYLEGKGKQLTAGKRRVSNDQGLFRREGKRDQTRRF